MKIKIKYKTGNTQIYTVISHQNEYLKVIKPLRARKNEIESLKKNKFKDEYQEIIEKLNKYNFKFVTDKSPIFKSLKTGKLCLLENQGGCHNVETTII